MTLSVNCLLTHRTFATVAPKLFPSKMGVCLANSISGQPRKASLAAVRELQTENHVDEILFDVKQNNNRERKKDLPVWLPLAESFNNGTRKAEDAVASGLYYVDIDEKGLTEKLWQKVCEERLIEAFRIVYFAESAGGGTHIWAWRKPELSIETSSNWQAGSVSVTTLMSPIWPAAVLWSANST